MFADKQKLALIISAVSALLFSFSGLILGAISGSVVILFDSAYSLLSLALASLSLLAMKLSQLPASRRFPFRRLTVEPLAILVKGVVILLVCIVSILIALHALWQGGREVNLDIALLFGVINVTGCLLTWGLISRCQGYASSDLVAAEKSQWQMDTWLSVAVLLGFALTWVLSLTPWARFAVFADPVMVLLIASYFIHIPWRMIKRALHQLMFGCADLKIQKALQNTLHEHAVFDFDAVQIGRYLIVQTVRSDLSPPALAQVREYLQQEQQLTLVLLPGARHKELMG